MAAKERGAVKLQAAVRRRQSRGEAQQHDEEKRLLIDGGKDARRERVGADQASGGRGEYTAREEEGEEGASEVTGRRRGYPNLQPKGGSSGDGEDRSWYQQHKARNLHADEQERAPERP